MTTPDVQSENRNTPAGTPAPWAEVRPTALLVLADGTIIEGHGIGATGEGPGELCFNTSMTGYQEILTDPSYSGQIVTFTFPHIGNVGVNGEDIETVNMARHAATGVVLGTDISNPSNWRSVEHFDAWLKSRGIVGIAGVDTRALTALIRDHGMPNAIVAHHPEGFFDRKALVETAKALPNMAGLDLVPNVTGTQSYDWKETTWTLGEGYGEQTAPQFHVVALDFGVKRNILRLLAGRGCKVTVLPPTSKPEDVLALKPDGVFLANGPGDPAATGQYAVPTIKAVLDAKIPTFGICLGHQMLALAIGAKTMKMAQGHHGANHPVKEHATGKVEIVSMNHGFAVDPKTLPGNAEETHISLFDGSNCGIRLTDRPAFSVQQHPEASPGPQDSHYLFDRFIEMMKKNKPA
ncbi:MAG: glutamine-hydrolyzing carbamoyl-phosphate synthase small subunit [Proteobacteria bacterium]|nr:glutamine-hydrolyzing carbamoyl-phosphate synthase small subunit [Pseudomonadota bacterium]